MLPYTQYLFIFAGLWSSELSASVWIDPQSCAPYGQKMLNAWAEAKSMGSTAFQRTRDENEGDPYPKDMGDFFKGIFKASKNDIVAGPRIDTVNDFIGSLTSTTDRASSEIRVYCENDARWVMHPDPKYRTTYAVEETNHMATFTSSLCNGTSLGTPYALTNRGRRIQSGENPNRAVVTLCDNLIKRQPGEPLKWTFTGGVRTVNWPAVAKQSSPRIMEGVVAHTIFHELAHISQPAKVIVDVAGQNSYGWDAVWNMPYADAIRNADNFVFYGDFSLLPGLWQDVEDAMDVASK